MITFDRQAGPLQNFNRSHVMVIGRSVLFSDPARPPGGGVGRPKIPPPPPKKINFCLHAFQNPRNIFEKKKFALFFFGVLRPQEHFLAKKCFQLNIPPPPVLTLATRMFVINEKLFLFAIVDRYPFATCAKDIFV